MPSAGGTCFIRSGEALTTVIVIGILVLMLGRWGVVLLTVRMKAKVKDD